MAKKRVTLHAGKIHASKHNDRSFDLTKSDHIIAERSNHNFYHIADAELRDKGLSFEQAEWDYYEKHFGELLEEKNERYIQSGHKEKCKTIHDYLKDERTCPRETIFQIGTKDDHVNAKELNQAFAEYVQWHEKTYPQIKTLNIAYHEDESTPHIHWRTCGIGHDTKSGKEYPSIKRALKEMGVERPDLTKPEHKYNNPTITYTDACRHKMQEICKKHGIDIETEPRENTKGVKSLKADIYRLNAEINECNQKVAEITREKAKITREKADAEKDLDKTINSLKRRSEELEACKSDLKKSLQEKQNVADAVKSAKDHNFRLRQENANIQAENNKLRMEIGDMNLEISRLQSDTDRLCAALEFEQKMIKAMEPMLQLIAVFMALSEKEKPLSENEKKLLAESNELHRMYNDMKKLNAQIECTDQKNVKQELLKHKKDLQLQINSQNKKIEKIVEDDPYDLQKRIEKAQKDAAKRNAERKRNQVKIEKSRPEYERTR